MIEDRAADPPKVVLDTNAVLDWLVFRDACIQPVVAALQSGRLRWVACLAMRQELTHMLGHASLLSWSPCAPAALSQFDSLAEMRPDPVTNPHVDLRCRDTDDQVFLDLALADGARWLLTHDRALLKLARGAAKKGLHIVRPSDWRSHP